MQPVQVPVLLPAMMPKPLTAFKDYGLYLANRHRNWRKHTRKFKTNNRSNKRF